MTTEEIIAMRTMGEGLSRQGQNWTDKERKRLEDMFYRGVGLSEIALELQRSETAIMQQLVNMDAFKNERPHRERETLPCPCRGCKQRKVCPDSLENRTKPCTAEEAPHV